MDFQLGDMSLFVCDTYTLFQESELPVKTDLKLYVLLCPKKNWKSVLYNVFMALMQFDAVNSCGLFFSCCYFQY